MTALAALTRLPRLASAPADLDETWSWYFVHLVLSGGGFWETLSIGLDAPLFAGMNVLIAKAWGPSLLALRIPQAVLGTLAIPLVFAVVERLHSRRLALLAATLAALSPFLLFYAKHARPYAQLLFFGLLFVYTFERTRPWRAWRRYLAVSACALLAVASHYYALAFLGAFYAVRLGAQVVDSRWTELRRDCVGGAIALCAVAPFAALLIRRLGSLSFPYWQRDPLGLAAIWSEEFLFLGTSLPFGGARAAFLNLLVAAFFLAPFLYALWRHPRVFLDQPVIALLGLAMPGGIALAGWVAGRDLLFYPRGFIPSAPFLLAGWVLVTRRLEIARWKRRGYVALGVIPLLVSSFGVATSAPAHPFFRGRELMAEIVENARRLESEFDLILVHHWWLTQYVSYHHPEPEQVRGLGLARRREASRAGELAAALRDLQALPHDARVLLLRNDLATSRSGGDDPVVGALAADRPLLRELPCREDPVPGESLLCDRMFLFGPASPPEP